MPHGLHVFHQGVRMQVSLAVSASWQSGIQGILLPPRTSPHHPGHRIYGEASQKPPPGRGAVEAPRALQGHHREPSELSAYTSPVAG